MNKNMKKITILASLIFCCIFLISCSNFFSGTNEPTTTTTTTTEEPSFFFAVDIERNRPYAVEVVKVRTGQHCILYLEKENINLVTEENMNKIINNFDNVIYPTVRKYYGEESDVDQNNKIILFGLDIRDGRSASSSYIGGYFTPYDLVNALYSNLKDMVYLDIVEGLQGRNTPQLFSTIAHEFAHLVSYNERTLKRNLPPLEVWLEEGIAQGAEHLYQSNWLTDSFLEFANSIDIIGGKRFLAWGADTKNFGEPSTLVDNYNSAYLFIQWLRTFTTDSLQHHLYHQIITNSYSDYRAIENVARQYSTHFSPDSTWDDILRDWNISCFVNSFTTEPLYRYYDKLLPESSRAIRFQLPQIWHETSPLPDLYPGEAAVIATFNSSPPYNVLNPVNIVKQNIKHAGIIVNNEVSGTIFRRNNLKFTKINTVNISINQQKVIKQVNSLFRHTNRFLMAYHTGTGTNDQKERISFNIEENNILLTEEQELNSIPININSKVSTRELFPACALYHLPH